MDRCQESISNRDIVERNQGQPLKHSSLGPFITRQMSLHTEQPRNVAHVMGVFPRGTFSHPQKLNSFSLRGTH